MSHGGTIRKLAGKTFDYCWDISLMVYGSSDIGWAKQLGEMLYEILGR